ncbi:MAG: DUF177 domain-containing protein [Oligosphaeraceae bacterium]|nr:DUF177 domain-containing protein [Oligosphaeraceae bacterium]
MELKNTLKLDLIELPPEGARLYGEVSFEDLQIEEEPRFFFTKPVSYELRLQPCGGQNVLLLGELQAEINLICDRCGKPGSMKLPADKVCHQYENAYGKYIDLTNDIREDILIVFPQKALCDRNCRGLCPKCGQDLNLEECECGVDAETQGELHNPWQGLDALQLE